MTHEWKVGDRFNRTITVSTDYEITRIDEKFVYLSDGKNIVIWPLFYLSDVMPLIPAPPEPQKLDTSKLMRRKGTENDILHYLHENPLGQVYCINASGYVTWSFPDGLENIPEPKLKGRREAILMSDGSILWSDAYPGTPSLLIERVVGRKWVEITEGDGMDES